jgi:hypothetical protein
MEKRLGKISGVKFGYVGYQDCQFGLSLEFSADGWGVGTTISEGWSLDIKCDKHCKWTEADRDAGFAKTMRKVNQIMQDAKVCDVTQLKGIPVEITFDNNMLVDWRVLKEVL